MAHPTFELVGGDTFTFSNEHITIAAETTIVPSPPAQPESVTVESVTLTFENPSTHGTFTLPVHDFVVPPPLVEHVFDQVAPSAASVPNATLSQEGTLTDLPMNDDQLVFNTTARPEPCECIADGLEDNPALLEQFSFSESDPLPNQHLLAGLLVVDQVTGHCLGDIFLV
jgi:hypothetical protein